MKVYTNHYPNHIPRGTRVMNLLLSTFLLVYGSYGVYIDDVYLPGKRTRGVHLHGEPAWLLYAAMFCAALNMLSVIVDHYDRRNNEWNYRRFAKATQWAGWGFFVLSLVLDLFVFHKGTRLEAVTINCLAYRPDGGCRRIWSSAVAAYLEAQTKRYACGHSCSPTERFRVVATRSTFFSPVEGSMTRSGLVTLMSARLGLQEFSCRKILSTWWSRLRWNV